MVRIRGRALVSGFNILGRDGSSIFIPIVLKSAYIGRVVDKRSPYIWETTKILVVAINVTIEEIPERARDPVFNIVLGIPMLRGIPRYRFMIISNLSIYW